MQPPPEHTRKRLAYKGVDGRSSRNGAVVANVFAIGGGLLWFALLSAGVNADIAGVIAGLAVSTQAQTLNADGATESFSER